jgi:hypothetical protein
MPKDAKAFSGNRELGEDEIVGPGQHLEFIRRSGEKGIS